MMMEMNVMAVALHLYLNVVEDMGQCQFFFAATRKEVENKTVLAKMRLTVLILAMLCIRQGCEAQYQNQDRDTPGVDATSADAPAPGLRIDINHASIDELLKVPGMTRSWAGRIVRFRPYRTKQELVEHGVVTDRVYDRIKDFVIAHRNPQ
jgi:DNA uptake protein ComE-like DNA-binding protein